ncbi:hypothetical protein [Propionibacterium australiense]|uniref:Uncharacterized protein n=1 Tax=Propionibacterium australiense TaxID=119981 RepID=A0A8B3FQ88_9ACTN|nr:hypothetical protein [Propionibacterium australiense]RLP12999.1 hypothetical protein D7U36_00785 [Propionibacterium australiense]
MIELDWVPKPFRDGDIAGEGTKKLLGTSLEVPSLLLRETAQNSWDARVGSGVVPEYQMRFTTLDAARMSVLRDMVVPRTAPDSPLSETVRKSRLPVVEIHDRGTTGLDGPTRNDIQVSKRSSTNFRDFILTVGAPRDQQYGGGTYGFGKTASFRASQCGTILVWTRIRNGAGFEERFIAVSVSPNFSMGGKRYTGQQWWGVRSSSKGVDNVQPITGSDAHELGEVLFERGFQHSETGTSIMILDPVFDDGREAFIRACADATIRNLWPKMIPGQPADRQMAISLTKDGEQVPLSAEHGAQELAERQRCLTAIREAQAGQESSDVFVRVEEIWCMKPKMLVGHLAITPCLFPVENDTTNTVTFMRNEAELVVRENDYPSLRNGRDNWVAVFKPVKECDDAFAAAEPPTHDDWNPSSLQRPQKTYVNVALKRIKEALVEYLRPADASIAPGEHVSTGELADSLRVLAMGTDGGHPSGLPSSKRRNTGGLRRNGKKKAVEVLSSDLLPLSRDSAPGQVSARMELRAPTGVNTMTVMPDLSIVVDGSGPIRDMDHVRIDSWTTAMGEVTGGESLEVHGGDVFFIDITYPENVAVNCAFRTEVTK